jgi:hypothetical protein
MNGYPALMSVQMSARKAGIEAEFAIEFLRPYPVAVAEIERFVDVPLHTVYPFKNLFGVEELRKFRTLTGLYTKD